MIGCPALCNGYIVYFGFWFVFARPVSLNIIYSVFALSATLLFLSEETFYPQHTKKTDLRFVFLIYSFGNIVITAFFKHRSYATSLWRAELARLLRTQYWRIIRYLTLLKVFLVSEKRDGGACCNRIE